MQVQTRVLVKHLVVRWPLDLLNLSNSVFFSLSRKH
jgi:hypothetical protein